MNGPIRAGTTRNAADQGRPAWEFSPARNEEYIVREIVSLIRKLLADQRGLEAVEYAIITGLIAASTIITIASIALLLSARFGALESMLSAH